MCREGFVNGLAFYNDCEPYAAEWLRNLINAGHISGGVVDQRSIEAIAARELAEFLRCHFFAGIGGWDHALWLAEWPALRKVWTGSCPCPPFSVAGNKRCPVCGSKRRGFLSGPNSAIEAFGCFDCEYRDARHLWPPFRSLIAERGPDVIFGEQVGSAAGREWLAGIQVDLEALGYSFAAADLCAAGVEAPHIRQRLYWVAYAKHGRGETWREIERREARNSSAGIAGRLGDSENANGWGELTEGRTERRRSGFSGDGRLGEPIQPGLERLAGNGNDRHEPRRHAARQDRPVTETGPVSRMAHTEIGRQRIDRSAPGNSRHPDECEQACGLADTDGSVAGHGNVQRCGQHGQQQENTVSRFWDAFDRVPCIDGKARRIEPGTFPLAHGIPARVGKLRAYGNAIVPQVAAEFIRAFLESERLTS